MEVEADKISSMPARENDLEIKTVKTPGPRSTFRSRFKVLFAWQVRGFRRVAKYVAGAGVCEGCKNVGSCGGFQEGPK